MSDKEQGVEQWPSDLIAFKWAETLSTGEQSVLLVRSLKRLQEIINLHLAQRPVVADPQLDEIRKQQSKHAALFDSHDSYKIVQRSEIRKMLNSIDHLLSCIQPAAGAAATLWTKERPTDDGHYWMRWQDQGLVGIFYVYRERIYLGLAEQHPPRDAEWLRIEYPTVAQPAGELTVESCLQDLREIFPRWKYFALTESIGAPRKRYWLKIGPSFYSADVVNVWGETLDELMSQVRSWKQEVGQKGS